MHERVIRAGGVELATEAFGDPQRPAILLIMGGMASMLWWPEELCRRLAGRGRYVIRYDHRDTGRSTKYPGYEHALNHGALKVGNAWRGRLNEIKAPLLVIHGTADPVYPFEHGVALSQAVKGAKLVRLDGGGHELHPADWDTIIEALFTHTNAA